MYSATWPPKMYLRSVSASSCFSSELYPTKRLSLCGMSRPPSRPPCQCQPKCQEVGLKLHLTGSTFQQIKAGLHRQECVRAYSWPALVSRTGTGGKGGGDKGFLPCLAMK